MAASFLIYGIVLEENEFPQIVAKTAADVFPDNPPNFLGRTPYGYYNLDLIKEELEGAGFSQINISFSRKKALELRQAIQ